MDFNGKRTPESHTPGELHFHYDREKRESMLADETRELLHDDRKFKLNRRNLIVIADIAFVIIISMIFVPLSGSTRKKASFEEYTAELRAYTYDQRVLVSLKITAIDEPAEAGASVSAVFGMKNNPDSEMTAALPSEKDGFTVIRTEFPFNGDGGVITATVRSGDIERKMSVKVKEE